MVGLPDFPPSLDGGYNNTNYKIFLAKANKRDSIFNPPSEDGGNS